MRYITTVMAAVMPMACSTMPSHWASYTWEMAPSTTPWSRA